MHTVAGEALLGQILGRQVHAEIGDLARLGEPAGDRVVDRSPERSRGVVSPRQEPGHDRDDARLLELL